MGRRPDSGGLSREPSKSWLLTPLLALPPRRSSCELHSCSGGNMPCRSVWFCLTLTNSCTVLPFSTELAHAGICLRFSDCLSTACHFLLIGQTKAGWAQRIQGDPRLSPALLSPPPRSLQYPVSPLFPTSAPSLSQRSLGLPQLMPPGMIFSFVLITAILLTVKKLLQCTLQWQPGRLPLSC